jgi:hypothetical protein
MSMPQAPPKSSHTIEYYDSKQRLYAVKKLARRKKENPSTSWIIGLHTLTYMWAIWLLWFGNARSRHGIKFASAVLSLQKEYSIDSSNLMLFKFSCHDKIQRRGAI